VARHPWLLGALGLLISSLVWLVVYLTDRSLLYLLAS
jgi:hypothetical protein